MRWVTGLLTIALLSSGCGGGDEAEPTRPPTSAESKTGSAMPTSANPTSGTPAAAMTLTSSAFPPGQPIPTRYSCKGGDIPPPLAWGGVPPGTVELALVVDDPDAVSGVFVHWVVLGIAPSAAGSPEGGVPPGGTVLPNSGGERRYLGPCPPPGTGVHHYRFTLYALDAPLDLDPGTPARRASAAIANAASATTRLVGTYRA